MGTFNDLSQLKHVKTATPKPPPPEEPEDRALAGAVSSSDYFSSLLGGGEGKARPSAQAPRRATVVTPATVARVRAEQAEDARTAERAAFQAREAALLEELDAQKAACESLAVDLARLRTARDEDKGKVEALEEANRRLEADLAAARAKPPEIRPDPEALAEREREIERLKAQLLEVQRDTCLHDPLLDAPEPFAEKFPGEVREHVVEALVAANEAAEAGGRDRRARILEAVLGANPPTGELERRREAVKKIVKSAGEHLDGAALAALEKLGFRYVSGNKHHKLEWAGIRFPLAKTPSDRRACLNSAAEIANRVF